MTPNPYELVKAEEMLIGYSARWFGEPYKALAVEAEFYAEALGVGETFDRKDEYGYPEICWTDRWYDLGGKLDVLARDLRTQDVVIVEHKSTIHDITEGSSYWAQTLMSSQLSTYMRGTRALGHEPRYILYDVLFRPQQRPLEATPEDKKKYTKPTKKEPIPRLYADQREHDETPDEFRLRVRSYIGERPNEIYKRQRVERFQREEDEAARDLWYTTETMRLAKKLERYPRNPDACVQIGRVCTFLAVCAGHGTLDDPTKFRRVADPHEELEGAGKRRLRVLTNSEISTFRTCQRLHHLRYNEGWRSVKATEPQRMGTLIHRGLEGWWLGNMHDEPEWKCVEKGIQMMREEPAKRVLLPEELVT